MVAGPDWITLVVFLALAGSFVYGHVRAGDPEEGTTEHAKWLYATGQITLDELERRLDVIECPETEKIRSAVEPIKGVGPDTSYSIAEHFDSLAGLRAAGQEDLQSVHGIGPSTATAIRERLDD